MCLHPPCWTSTCTEAATTSCPPADQHSCLEPVSPPQPRAGEPKPAVRSAAPSHQPTRCLLRHRAEVSPDRTLHTMLSQFRRSHSARFRFQRQLSEPSLVNAPYQPSRRDGRPLYQRHLSEPLVPHGPRGFKQELLDPRYPEPGPPAPGLSRPQTAFNHVTIKQEPRDFGFDSGVFGICYEPLRLPAGFQHIHDDLFSCRGSNLPVVLIREVPSPVPE